MIICDPSIHTVDHPDFIAYSFMENPIGLKRVTCLYQMKYETSVVLTHANFISCD